MFAYCGNNPIITTDPTGEAFLLITAAIGAIAGAILGGINAAKNGENILGGAATGAAIGGASGLGFGAAAGVLLAGSAVASTASVAVGANAFTATVSASGLAAGGMMLADNVSQSMNHAPQVFWSGGDTAMNAAKSFASSIDGLTLEMTRLGQYLEQTPFNRDAWSAASQNFANVANNAASTIHVVHNAAGVKLQSMWATIEYPLLQMADMIYHVVH